MPTGADWVDLNDAFPPLSQGNNRTWNIWFDRDGPAKANDFARHWERYRLLGSASTEPGIGAAAPVGPAPRSFGEFIATPLLSSQGSTVSRISRKNERIFTDPNFSPISRRAKRSPPRELDDDIVA
jgi:hypothetical protein